MVDPRNQVVIQIPEDLAYRDDLTGLHNRRLINHILDERWKELQAVENGCSMIVIDLDHFKEVNDRFGHLSGDVILKDTASLLLKSFRGSDIV
ncbi:MAG: GGDEF domain-containing protein, partial [Planctomycetota bacterium]